MTTAIKTAKLSKILWVEGPVVEITGIVHLLSISTGSVYRITTDRRVVLEALEAITSGEYGTLDDTEIDGLNQLFDEANVMSTTVDDDGNLVTETRAIAFLTLTKRHDTGDVAVIGSTYDEEIA